MFFNLRLMCDALGKAVLRHIQFAQQYSLKPDSLQSSGSDFDDGVLWFLDQLNEAKLLKKKVEKQQRKNSETIPEEINLEESATTIATEPAQFSYNFDEQLKINRQLQSADTDLELSRGHQDINLQDIEVGRFDEKEGTLEIAKIEHSLEKDETKQTELQIREQFQIEKIRREELEKQLVKTSPVNKSKVPQNSYVQM